MAKGVGVWEPKRQVSLDTESLRQLGRVMAGADLADLGGALTTDEIRDGSAFIKQPEPAWQVAGSLDDAEIIALIRLFTLGEMQLPGWEGGKASPVIYLVRILKEREAFTPELRKWIKANTDNRYLPNGSVP